MIREDARLRETRPTVSCKVFMRQEDWIAVKGRFSSLSQASYEMLYPFIDGYDTDIRYEDVHGVYTPSAAKYSPDFAWVRAQPECEWLSAALPHEDTGNFKIAYDAALRKMRLLADRKGSDLITLDMNPVEFLRHCEAIRAVKRIGNGSLLWSRLWYNGCLEFVRSST
jgi:hypothetical protein